MQCKQRFFLGTLLLLSVMTHQLVLELDSLPHFLGKSKLDRRQALDGLDILI